MIVNTCRACDSPTPDGVLCWPCTGRLRRTLAALARVLPELVTTAAGMGSKTGGGGRSTGHGPGIHVDALDVAAECRTVMRAIARDLIDSGRVPVGALPPRPAGADYLSDPVRLALFLCEHVDAVRQHPAAADWLDELTADARAVWVAPDGQRVTFTRPPLVDYVLAAVDRHRDPRPLDARQLARAADAADRWVSIPVLMAALPVLVPDGVEVPNRSTVYEWVNGRKATDRRRAVPPRLFKLGKTVRVGSVLELIRSRASVHEF